MGLSVLNQPAAAGGGIKSVQRGSAGGAGNVTITAVDIAKSFVTVFGTTSSGTVAASAAVGAYSITNSSANISIPQHEMKVRGYAAGQTWGASNCANNGFGSIDAHTASLAGSTSNAASTNLTGGSNNLVAAVVQGYLSNSTTLVVSGACRWEVVEFN